MLRMRRYRIFLMVAALSAATLYWLVNVRQADVERFRHFSFGHNEDKDKPTEPHEPPVPQPGLAESPPDPETKLPPPPTTTATHNIHTILDDLAGQTPTSTAAVVAETVTGEELLWQKPEKDDEPERVSGSEKQSEHVNAEGPRSHWQPQKEHNPVSEESLIRLPKGKPKTLSKVQHNFPSETDAEKSDRLRKLVSVRQAFKHAWQGYEKFAMPHDELWAVSKGFGDSFMGWGATLIDSLDTLWIMDLKEEFEKAVNATEKIDFKTSHKKEIPVFETVIRVLGGLLSAYDLSSEQYPILLQKAVELGNILLGAFDTPNRMPDMFYKWAPAYASQYHRAGSRVVVAELGSLSLEFTRLAQLTGEHKFYDAIARVQNSLQEWQMDTEMPGLWPLKLDASGCKKTDSAKAQADSADHSEKPILLDMAQLSDEELLQGATPAGILPGEAGDQTKHSKRQADDFSPPSPDTDDEKAEKKKEANAASSKPVALLDDESADPYCKPQGLNYEPYGKKHKFAIGGQADSAYEYMPKMYRLLGGLSSQYESMYTNAAKMMRDKILYRPMIEDETRKILFPALYEFDTSKKIGSKRMTTIWEGTHLGCYAGGMFGLAAKTFGVSSDIEIAKQLTDGCIWAYESTPTKIMPEKFALVPCDDSTSCPWSEAKWHKALDPNLKERMDAVDAWNTEQKKLYQQTGINVVKDSKHHDTSRPMPAVYKGGIKKEDDTTEKDSLIKRDPPVKEDPIEKVPETADADEVILEQFGFVPKVAMSHERYVKARIQEERLPPSFTKIYDRTYILRPEAIESVFIMWRITGEDYWRKQGWKMFQAIQEATHTEAGNAELEDVTSILGEKKDKMESFWLAETLKYFYLLFSEPNVVSLDDWVLNTEAHPLLVPKK